MEAPSPPALHPSLAEQRRAGPFSEPPSTEFPSVPGEGAARYIAVLPWPPADTRSPPSSFSRRRISFRRQSDGSRAARGEPTRPAPSCRRVGAIWGLIVAAGLAGTARPALCACGAPEVGAAFDLSSFLPRCLQEPCLLAGLTPHKGRRKSRPEVLRRAAWQREGPCN